jgi:hypothetical protein
MGKVGRFVVDPKAGAYCQVVLDTGDKLLVNHDKGGFKGGTLSISQSKWLGLASEPLLEVDLDSSAGKAALARLTQGVDASSARATPLGAFAEFVKDGKDVQDVVTRCRGLIGQEGGG